MHVTLMSLLKVLHQNVDVCYCVVQYSTACLCALPSCLFVHTALYQNVLCTGVCLCSSLLKWYTTNYRPGMAYSSILTCSCKRKGAKEGLFHFLQFLSKCGLSQVLLTKAAWFGCREGTKIFSFHHHVQDILSPESLRLSAL